VARRRKNKKNKRLRRNWFTNFADPSKLSLTSRRQAHDYRQEFVETVDEIKKSYDIKYHLNKNTSKSTQNVLSKLKEVKDAAQPLQKIKTCLKRQIRKEIMHATKKTGKGNNNKKPIFTEESKTRC
jgi:hypothetical protein